MKRRIARQLIRIARRLDPSEHRLDVLRDHYDHTDMSAAISDATLEHTTSHRINVNVGMAVHEAERRLADAQRQARGMSSF